MPNGWISISTYLERVKRREFKEVVIQTGEDIPGLRQECDDEGSSPNTSTSMGR
jgi:hypothetical protein